METEELISENSNQQTKEKSQKSLQDIAIIIHPLFTLYDIDNQKNLDYATQITNKLEDSNPDVIFFMPGIFGNDLSSWKQKLKTIKTIKKNDHDSFLWTDFYRSLKEKFPDKVRLAKDLIDEEEATTFIDQLKANEEEVTPSTKVTIMGEHLDACVLNITDKLLLLPNISSLTIDTNNSSTRKGKTKDEAISSFLDYFNNFADLRTEINEQGEILIHKKSE